MENDALYGADTPVEEAEVVAVEEEEFDRVPGLDGPNTDSGYADENTTYAEAVEEGAGARRDPSEVSDLGMHIEDMT